jgi:Putative intracellular protease/amidase
MNILILLAKGFEMMEFSPFVDVMGWAKTDYGHDINITTCGFHKQVTSAFNIEITVDKLIDDVDINCFDALVIPGGFEEFGFYSEAYKENFLSIIRKFNLQEKLIASVCVGALPIGKSGVLQNRKGTTYNLNNGRRQNQLSDFGVNVVNEPIVTDENIITSYCPQTAPHVAFKVLELLTSKPQADIVKSAMGFTSQT